MPIRRVGNGLGERADVAWTAAAVCRYQCPLSKTWLSKVNRPLDTIVQRPGKCLAPVWSINATQQPVVLFAAQGKDRIDLGSSP
jgi:hypothetical protein